MFGIDLEDYVYQPWEQARGFLFETISQMKAELRGRWNAVFTDNQINNEAIAGDGTAATRYVANTGPNNAPKWDRVNLANGVKGRLPFANIVQIAAAVLLGRGSGTAGNIQEIELGTGLEMVGNVLNVTATGGGVPYFVPADESFTIADNVQAFWHLPIDVEGTLEVDGILIWIDA